MKLKQMFLMTAISALTSGAVMAQKTPDKKGPPVIDSAAICPARAGWGAPVVTSDSSGEHVSVNYTAVQLANGDSAIVQIDYNNVKHDQKIDEDDWEMTDIWAVHGGDNAELALLKDSIGGVDVAFYYETSNNLPDIPGHPLLKKAVKRIVYFDNVYTAHENLADIITTGCDPAQIKKFIGVVKNVATQPE